MEIMIFGPGCPKCEAMERNAKEALDSLDVEGTITKITDLNEMAQYGVMLTPALAIDGEVVVSGRVAGANQIGKWIQDRL